MPETATNSPKLIGRALLIGNRVAAQDSEAFATQGLHVELTPNPYAAIAELVSRPLVYRALVLPMPQLFQEELALVRVVKKRFPHVQVIASELSIKSTRVEELRRLGVDAILFEREFHPLPQITRIEAPPIASSPKITADHEPVLTADELRALLSEEILPPSGTEPR